MHQGHHPGPQDYSQQSAFGNGFVKNFRKIMFAQNILSTGMEMVMWEGKSLRNNRIQGSQ